jgi:hypothetical protein
MKAASVQHLHQSSSDDVATWCPGAPRQPVRIPELGSITTQEKCMNRPVPKIMRRRFFVALGRAIHLTWPVLSTILVAQVVLGLLIGFIEGWSIVDAMYFTFITGLTIGYGDVVPRQVLARVLAIGIGVSGLFLTGVVAAIAVHAMRTALTDSDD